MPKDQASFYRPDRFGAALQTGAALLWLVQAAVIARAVQGLLEGNGVATVWPAAMSMLVIGMLRALTNAYGERLLYITARAHITALRECAVLALASRSPLDSTRAQSGLAASVLAEQAEAVLPYLARYLPVRQRVMTLPWVIAAAVAWYSWISALVLLLAAPLIPLFMALVGWRAKAASEAQWAEMGGMNAFLLDRLRGLTTLRALGAVEHTTKRLDATAQSLRHRTMRVLRIAFLSSAVLELFSALGVALVAVYVGFHLLGSLHFGAWGQTLSLGQGLFVLLLAPAFFEPLRDLAGVWHDRATGITALQALQGLAEHGTPLPEGHMTEAAQTPSAAAAQASTSIPINAGAPAVKLRGVTVRPPGAVEPVFDNLSLDIAAGEHLALTGTSGSGKSMLLAAVAGLLPLQEGHIVVGSRWETIHTQGPRIGWVGQKPHIFAGTVLDNVTLGRPGVKRAEVHSALALVHLSEVEQARPDQMLGEGGLGLSGGEAVRLALARVAADPSIQLILADEPTAHLDRHTAAEVIQSLVQLAQRRTLVVATHDPLLAAAMDRQVAIHDLHPGRGPAASVVLLATAASGAEAL
ncbi:thiol reductant ABC exporter subunit CydD [Ralstonia sp. A12]|uniref:thiol reductant ABC exporter subunit CydD n=1 Tax=Ralstonia sp. A12 TaxID=1217052 RepID=UPI0012EDF1CF|nr:thiol reductant ABC exporter subunit CydD [Ralstonia sp. A12]